MKSFFFCLSLALSVAAGLPGLACPGPENLAKGVVFKTEGGTIETHSRFAKDWILIRTQFPDGGGALLETSHGLYLHSTTPIENGVIQLGQKDVFATRPELDKWDAPKPNAEWSNPSPGGGTAKSGAVRTIRLGECSYMAYEIALTFNDDPTYQEYYHYLPEIGVGLLVASETNGAEEFYTYVSVEAVR